jgi:hypothetical protein
MYQQLLEDLEYLDYHLYLVRQPDLEALEFPAHQPDPEDQPDLEYQQHLSDQLVLYLLLHPLLQQVNPMWLNL